MLNEKIVSSEKKNILSKEINLFINLLNIEKGLSNNTIQAYKNDLYDLTNQEFMKSVKNWNNFDRSHFQQFVEVMNSREYKQSTKSRKIACIKSYIKFLLLEGFITINPLKEVRQPKNNQKIPKTLSSNQIEKILEYSSNGTSNKEIRDNAMIELMYATGIRVSEIVNLNHNDIDLYSATIKVNGKGRKQRIIPLHEWAVKILENYGFASILKKKFNDL